MNLGASGAPKYFLPRASYTRARTDASLTSSATPAIGGALEGAPPPAINDPADTGIALHGLPLGAGRASADIVRTVEEHKPYWHHAGIALAVEIGEPQELFLLAERV